MSALSNFPATTGSQVLAADFEQIRKNTVIIMTAGEGITAGMPVYQKVSDSKAYKTNATTAGEACFNFIGFAVQTAATNDTFAVSLDYSDNQSSLTVGSAYYLTNTAGGISTTPGTNLVYIGTAISTTEILRDYKRLDPISSSSSVSVSGSGTSYTTDDSTVMTLVLPRPCRVLLNFSGQEGTIFPNAQNQSFTVSFNIDSAATIITGYSVSYQVDGFGKSLASSCSTVTALLAAGSHTFNMRVSGSSISSMSRGISGTLYATCLT